MFDNSYPVTVIHHGCLVLETPEKLAPEFDRYLTGYGACDGGPFTETGKLSNRTYFYDLPLEANRG